MKFVRFIKGGMTRYGIAEGDTVTAITDNPLISVAKKKERFEARDVDIIAPVSPTKIIAVGLNYTDHARELGLPLPQEPLIFMKPPSSVIGPSETIYYPPQAKRVDYEAELAIVIKRRASDVHEEKAEDYIFGYTCLNDVTARDLQEKDGQWTRAKSFDTFCPIGPHVETDLDTSSLKIELFLNKGLKQSSDTSKMVFSCCKLVAFISGIMTLEPGDIIATGTPPGVGPVAIGDDVEVRIEGLGSLRNRVGTRRSGPAGT